MTILCLPPHTTHAAQPLELEGDRGKYDKGMKLTRRMVGSRIREKKKRRKMNEE